MHTDMQYSVQVLYLIYSSSKKSKPFFDIKIISFLIGTSKKQTIISGFTIPFVLIE